MKLIEQGFIHRIINSNLIKFATTLVATLFFHTQNAVAQSFYNDNDSSSSTMRYGLMVNQMVTGSYGGFFEYQFNAYFGFRSGLEYGYNFCIILPKNLVKEQGSKRTKETIDMFLLRQNLPLNLKNDIGMYISKFIAIPICARLYPAGGDFSIYLGIEVDILIKALRYTTGSENADSSKDKEDLDKLKDDIGKMLNRAMEKAKDIKKTDKDTDGKELLNPVRFKLLWGLDYGTSFGLIFGFKASHTITNFINYNKDFLDSYFDGTFQLVLGLDIAKLIH
jgi:hypothetical protein